MIKFVYFDVGGVALKDFSATDKWEQLIEELGVPKNKVSEFDEFWKIEAKNSSLDLDVETLLPLIAKQFNAHISPGYSLLIDGFVNRFEPNKTIRPVIKEISKKAKIGLLTNMYPNMFEAIEKRGLLPDVDWAVVIDSSKVMLQKPDRKIFKYAQVQTNVKGEEILFVENSREHTEAAKKFGWQVYFYDSKNYEESSNNLLNWFNNNYRN